LKSSSNLREAFLVFLTLTVIALFDAGQLWERQEISMRYATMEIIQLLELDQAQVDRIRSINTAFEIGVSRTSSENSKLQEDKIRILLCERNKRIMEVLDARQKSVLHSYCTNLVSVAKVKE